MELTKATTAFLACHWENDVVGADGAFAPFFHAEVERRGVIDVAKRVLDGARQAGAQVVYARVAFKDGHSDLVTNIPLLGVVAQQGSLLDGTSATEIIDELKSSCSVSPPTSRSRAPAAPQATSATASSSSRTPARPPTRQPTTPRSPRSTSSARSPPPMTSSRPSDPQPASASWTHPGPTRGPSS